MLWLNTFNQSLVQQFGQFLPLFELFFVHLSIGLYIFKLDELFNDQAYLVRFLRLQLFIFILNSRIA